MASSTESIGRLVANEVLLSTERQLLRRQDPSGQQPEEQYEEASAPPISHDDKTMASVLRTILDEQLNAATADPKRQLADAAAAPMRDGQTASVTSQVAARYAQDEAVFRSELPDRGPAPSLQTNPEILFAASSPELRMMMQGALMAAAARLQSENSDDGDRSRDRQSGGFRDAPSIMQIGGAIVAAIFALAILVLLFAH